MNQNIILQGKEYKITGIDETGTKFFLTGPNEEQGALGIEAALLHVYTTQCTSQMEQFNNVDEFKKFISNVENCLLNNEVYLRMKELVPTLSLSEETLNRRIEELNAYFVSKYPNKVSANQTSSTMEVENTPEKPVQEVNNIETNSNTSDVVFVPLREINVNLIDHSQKAIRQYLMNKYAEYEVTEDLNMARDPRTGETYHMSINDSGMIQMISTNRDLKQELADTPALTEARKAELLAMSINELRSLRDTTDNLAEVNFINEIIANRKSENSLDDTVLLDQNFLAEQNSKSLVKEKVLNAGFVSNLAISFLVGVLGGIFLVIVGNSISMFF